MLLGLCIVFFFLVVGKAIEQFFQLPLPGSIIGMILLIASQFAIPRLHLAIKDIADIFQRYLALIYFPLGVLVVLEYQPLMQDWLSVVLGITVATALAIVIIGFIASFCFKPRKPLTGKEPLKNTAPSGNSPHASNDGADL